MKLIVTLDNGYYYVFYRIARLLTQDLTLNDPLRLFLPHPRKEQAFKPRLRLSLPCMPPTSPLIPTTQLHRDRKAATLYEHSL